MNQFWDQFTYSLALWGRGLRRVASNVWRGLGVVLGDVSYSLANAPRALGKALRAILRLLVVLLLFPWRLIRTLTRLPTGLREVSGMAAELAEEQKRTLARNVEGTAFDLVKQRGSIKRRLAVFWVRLRSWVQDLPLFLKVAGGMGVLAMLVALAFAPAILQLIDDLRSDRLIRQAEELYAEGRQVQAFLMSQSAHLIDPEDPHLLATLVDHAQAIRHPGTLGWSQNLAQRRGGDAESLISLVETAQRFNRAEIAEPYLVRLRERLAGDPRLAALEVQNLLIQDRRAAAFRLAREAIKGGNRDPELVRLYGFLGRESGQPEQVEDTLAFLGSVLSEGGEVSLVAARQLLQQSDLTPRDASRYAAILYQHPAASSAMKLEGVVHEIRSGATDYEQRQEEIERWGSEIPEEEFALWHFTHGFHESLLARVDARMALEERTYFMTRVLSLVETDRTEEAFTLLDNPGGVPVTEVERLLLRAQVLRAAGLADAYTFTVNQAIAEAERDDFAWLENVIKSLGDRELLLPLYERIAKEPRTARVGLGQLLLYSYALQDEKRLLTNIPHAWIELFRFSPVVQSLIGYVDALRGERVARNLAELERVVAENPEALDFQVSLALTYYRLGRFLEASAILEDTLGPELAVSPGLYAVAATILERVHPDAEPYTLEDPEALLSLELAFLEEPAVPLETVQVTP